MLPIPPTIGRARLRQTAAGVRFAIPVQRSAYKFFLSLGTVVFIVWIPQQRQEDSKIVLLLAAAMILANVARNWFWNLLGEEIVTINKSALSLRYDVWGIGWTRTCFLDRVSGLRFRRLATRQQLQENEIQGNLDGSHFGLLEFDCDSDTPRFGRGLSETDAQELIGLLEGYAGAPLTSARVLPARPLPSGIVAQEVNRNLGVTFVMLWAAGTFCFLGTLLELTAARVGADLIGLLFAAVATVAAAGYRYRFTSRGIEISTLGIPLR